MGKNAEALGDSCCCYCILALVPIVNLIVRVSQRGKIRERQGIDGSIISDILCAFCLPLCSLVQEAQEVQHMQGGMAQDIERKWVHALPLRRHLWKKMGTIGWMLVSPSRGCMVVVWEVASSDGKLPHYDWAIIDYWLCALKHSLKPLTFSLSVGCYYFILHLTAASHFRFVFQWPDRYVLSLSKKYSLCLIRK